MPPTYHDLTKEFSKELVLSLPPHRSYDYAIDLLPGAPLPLVYLSRPERESKEDYINNSLATGLIRSSSSPLEVGFFFVVKKAGTLCAFSPDHWCHYLGPEPDLGTGPSNQLFVLEEVQSQVLQWGHSSRLTCHPRAQQTLQFLHQHFWWPS